MLSRLSRRLIGCNFRLGILLALGATSVSCTSNLCHPDPCAGQPDTKCSQGRCVTGELTIESSDNGTVAGSWTSYGGAQVHFSVTTAGGDDATATFDVAGGSTVVAHVDAKDHGTVTVGDVTVDGNGNATAKVTQAVTDLAVNVATLAMVPLELACHGTKIEASQLAALVMPWQLLLKYGVTARLEQVQGITAGASCSFFVDPVNQAAVVSQPPNDLQLSFDDPIPNVFGFFPFDDTGAVEPETTYSKAIWPQGKASGPCGTKCRGACGPDCSPNACQLRIEWRCIQDENGNTGEEAEYDVMTCGAAAGCISHDQCFDDCNAKWGCATWLAGNCMHNLLNGCDVMAAASFGTDNCWSWKSGGGPYETYLEYWYPAGTESNMINEKRCPPGTPGKQAAAYCQDSCNSDADCANGMDCFYTTVGYICLPVSCMDCFHSGLTCHYNNIPDTTGHGHKLCSFDHCGDSTPDASVSAPDASTPPDSCTGAGQQLCGSVCVDTLTDLHNCGNCDHACGGTPPGCCGGTCEDLSVGNYNGYDAITNCGSCGTTCPGVPYDLGVGAYCSGGGCFCVGGPPWCPS